jgi:hypothetical protein
MGIWAATENGEQRGTGRPFDAVRLRSPELAQDRRRVKGW